MTPKELIAHTRLLASTQLPEHLVKKFAFNPTEPHGETSTDLNVEFRIEVVAELLHDFSKKDLPLIRELYKQELSCERLIWRHDNIYQLSYHLFELGQIEDCFLIYEAKYQIRHMDIATMMDREMLTVGHHIDEVISFVEQKFKDDPKLEEKYAGIIEELIGLKEYPDCDSEEYKAFIKNYYLSHDKLDQSNPGTTTEAVSRQELRKKKSWWKFW